MTWIPLDSQYGTSFRFGFRGWHSTWLTTGTTVATSRMASSVFCVKLLTPMPRHVGPTSGSIRFQVSTKVGLSPGRSDVLPSAGDSAHGQCMRKTST